VAIALTKQRCSLSLLNSSTHVPRVKSQPGKVPDKLAWLLSPQAAAMLSLRCREPCRALRGLARAGATRWWPRPCSPEPAPCHRQRQPASPHSRCHHTAGFASEPVLPRCWGHLGAFIASEPVTSQPPSPHSLHCLSLRRLTAQVASDLASPHSRIASQPPHLTAPSPHSPRHLPDRVFQLSLSFSPPAALPALPHRQWPPAPQHQGHDRLLSA